MARTMKKVDQKVMRDLFIQEAGEGFDAMFSGINSAIEGGCTKASINFTMKIAQREDMKFSVTFTTKPSYDYVAAEYTAEMVQGVLDLEG